MKRRHCIIVVMVMAVATAGVVNAKFDRADDAIRYRQSVMVIIGQHFGRMAAVVKGNENYDPAEFENEAAVFAMLSKLPWEAFLYPGSDQGKTQLSSKALKNPNDFMKAAQAFENNAAGLAATAQKGELEAVKAQFGAVAQTCKGCHSEYRSR